MEYFVCDSTGGLVARRSDAEPSQVVRAEVGEPGFAFVRMGAGRFVDHLMGFVNDNGFALNLPRNVVGSCVLMTLGASRQPYAGPILLTGWGASGDGPGVRNPSDDAARHIRKVHRSVRLALGLDQGSLATDVRPGWAAAVVDLARFVRTSPTPQLQYVVVDAPPVA